MKRILPLFLLAWLILPGCEEEQPPPPDLIKEDTYIDLLVEMQMVKSLQETLLPNSNVSDTLIPKVMNKYGVTVDQFRRSHSYYEQQITEQRERIDEAIERMRVDQSSWDPSAYRNYENQ